MRLARFTVNGLFDLFDHSIEFFLDKRITIIHAPNGFGKTVLLKMLSGFFGGSLSIFATTEYSSAEFVFTDGTSVRFVSDHPDQEMLFEDDKPPIRRRKPYTVYYKKDEETHEWSPQMNIQKLKNSNIDYIPFSQFIPHLQRQPGGIWYDKNHNDRISEDTLVERYWEQLPKVFFRDRKHPDWLEKARSSFSCQFIETQRLVTLEKTNSGRYSEEPILTPVVKKCAQVLKEAIAALLARSATISQNLDQTFPNRLLAHLKDVDVVPDEAVVRDQLNELEKKRERLAAAALLDTGSSSGLLQADDKQEPHTLRLLSLYAKDSADKLKIFDDTLDKIELFKEILNRRFKFKRIIINRNEGFEFKDHRDRPIAPDMLSSGEQHELVLIFDLLFRTIKNSLILIDEPEISLHVAWQRRFLFDLERIIALTEIDTLVSTHSPQLIADYIDYAVQLKAPEHGNFQ